MGSTHLDNMKVSTGGKYESNMKISTGGKYESNMKVSTGGKYESNMKISTGGITFGDFMDFLSVLSKGSQRDKVANFCQF